jgi:hypothetical protein
VSSIATDTTTSAPANLALDRVLRTLITRARPRRIIETGTHLGLGTTLTICQALAENGLPIDEFYSIEANPNFYAQAWNNLGQRGFRPRLLRGLSIPRSLLPAEGELRRTYSADQTAALQQEAYFPDALDDLLGFVLGNFDGAPDFLLLDSAEHLGFIEFQYAFSRIKGPCYLALNGVRPIKHARGLQVVENDPRFKLLELSLENGGYCLAHFSP